MNNHHAGYIIPGSAVKRQVVEGFVKAEERSEAERALTRTSRHANLHQLPNNIAQGSLS